MWAMARPGLITIKLSEEELRQLEEIAAKLGVTKQAVLRMLIKLYAPKLIQALDSVKP